MSSKAEDGIRTYTVAQGCARDIRRAVALTCGRYLTDERPEETAAELHAFFSGKV